MYNLEVQTTGLEMDLLPPNAPPNLRVDLSFLLMIMLGHTLNWISSLF